ncbi:hypothetical protein BT96DRAFT_947845 [Gymnopus androsaceus JB14]|uniref:Uncharacterized protein n=1 Tax=Gymnopus androsaceus JB14 TaxID=1447944 RepID=A0A6A4GR47_9AGAR|nr:hypothetical protein BT96DRAFT_947845 [Gymnopus androsaceus JB14]
MPTVGNKIRFNKSLDWSNYATDVRDAYWWMAFKKLWMDNTDAKVEELIRQCWMLKNYTMVCKKDKPPTLISKSSYFLAILQRRFLLATSFKLLTRKSVVHDTDVRDTYWWMAFKKLWMDDTDAKVEELYPFNAGR